MSCEFGDSETSVNNWPEEVGGCDRIENMNRQF